MSKFKVGDKVVWGDEKKVRTIKRKCTAFEGAWHLGSKEYSSCDECNLTLIEEKSKPIYKVTTQNLQMVLRGCGYELPVNLIDNIIDIVELIEDKGDNVTLQDVVELRERWV